MLPLLGCLGNIRQIRQKFAILAMLRSAVVVGDAPMVFGMARLPRSQIPHHGAGKYGIAGYLPAAWLALRFNVFGIPYGRAFDGNTTAGVV